VDPIRRFVVEDSFKDEVIAVKNFKYEYL